MNIAIVCGRYIGKNHEEIEAHIQKARAAAIELWEAGYAVFTPHLNSAHFEVDCKAGEGAFRAGDLEIMFRLSKSYPDTTTAARPHTVAVVLDNWESSAGAQWELFWFQQWHVPIKHWPEDREWLLEERTREER